MKVKEQSIEGPADATRGTAIQNALRDLSAKVIDKRQTFDAAGCLPADLIDTLADIGMFRLLLPAALGGQELSALEFMDAVEEAAALDGTIGWLVGNGSGMSRVGAFLPDHSAREIFGDPRAFVVGGTGGLGRAVRVDGGYRVTGRWAFGSGSSHATWFSPVCELAEDGETTGARIWVYAPRGDVVLHDNWQVSGLRGTGSVDFEFRDVFVPGRFTHAFQPTPTHPGTLYRLPTLAILPWTVATVPLGLARGAMTEFLRIGGRHKRRGDLVPMAERELVQSELGRIEARLGAARAYMRQAMTDLLRGVETGADLVPLRVTLRLACTLAGETALSAIDRLTELAGTVAIRQSCPLERYERDARAAIKHIAMSPAAYITGGRLLLGQDLSNQGF